MHRLFAHLFLKPYWFAHEESSGRPMGAHHLVLAQIGRHNATMRQPGRQRTSIRPLAMLEVLRRRGRAWGLLAQYEEARLRNYCSPVDTAE